MHIPTRHAPKLIARLCAAGLLLSLGTGCNTAKVDEPVSGSPVSGSGTSGKTALKSALKSAPSAPVVAKPSAGLPSSEKPAKTPPVEEKSVVAKAPSAQLPSAKQVGSVPSAKPVEPQSPTITVTLKASPRVAARVRMGSKRMGTIVPGRALVIERPRDSGPLDLVIRATGFIPVHTRAYTFEDSLFTVKLTKKEEQETLYGYRKPLPPVDAGVLVEEP